VPPFPAQDSGFHQLEPARLKFQSGVESHIIWIASLVAKALYSNEEQALQTGALGLSPPQVGCLLWLGQLRRPIDQKKGAIRDANVTGIQKERQ
jgi:hypothetical protein